MHKREKCTEIIGFKTSVCRVETGSFSYRWKDVYMNDWVKGWLWERLQIRIIILWEHKRERIFECSLRKYNSLLCAQLSIWWNSGICHGGHHSRSPVNIPYPPLVRGSRPHWGLSPSNIWLFPPPWLTSPELHSASWNHFLSKLLVLKIFPLTFLWRESKDTCRIDAW